MGSPPSSSIPKGEAVLPIGGPPLGINWSQEPSLSQVILKEGAAPETDDEVAFDSRLFDKCRLRGR